MILVALFTVKLPIKSASCATRLRILANACEVISIWVLEVYLLSIESGKFVVDVKHPGFGYRDGLVTQG
jgi:hypothetical protein